MQKKSSKKSRSRAEILAEIAALPPSVQGTISSYRCPRKNGPPAVYHNLQYTRGGKNHSFSIPVGKVSEFKAAVAAGRKLRDLVFELSLADANEIASSESPLKKLAHLVLRGDATEAMDFRRRVAEVARAYPENRMFGHILPAWGLYLRHADDVRLENVTLRLTAADAREEAAVTSDVTGLSIERCAFP